MLAIPSASAYEPKRDNGAGGSLSESAVNPPVLPSLAVLLVCRNRRDTTVAAVRRLKQQSLLPAYRIVLFDDASTDGTIEAVLAEAPDAVVVRGDGNAFWNGGLYLAWQRALGLPCEAFLWLNDDVVLDRDAFRRLAEGWVEMRGRGMSGAFVLVGATRDRDGTVSYGGLRRVRTPVALRLDRVQPGASLAPVDTFNGNVVLVPRAVVQRIGINDPVYFHNFGDVDYGLRASQAGIPIMMLPGTLGACELNTTKRDRGFGSSSLSLRDQWRKVNTHHGLPFASWWRFTRRHSGAWWPLHFLLPYRRLVLPRPGSARRNNSTQRGA
jgi:GT2 family glycosyltransferase